MASETEKYPAHREPAASPEPRLPHHRRPRLALASLRVSPAHDRGRERPPRGRLRRRREPLVELRPVAAWHPVVPTAVHALHGEVRALLAPARLADQRWGRLSCPPRSARRRGDGDRGAPVPRRTRGGDVPRGNATAEGDAKEVRGQVAHRRGAHRARGRAFRSFPRALPAPSASAASRRSGSRSARPSISPTSVALISPETLPSQPNDSAPRSSGSSSRSRDHRARHCSRSTATRSPTGPFTGSRVRSDARTVVRGTCSAVSSRWS